MGPRSRRARGVARPSPRGRGAGPTSPGRGPAAGRPRPERGRARGAVLPPSRALAADRPQNSVPGAAPETNLDQEVDLDQDPESRVLEVVHLDVLGREVDPRLNRSLKVHPHGNRGPGREAGPRDPGPTVGRHGDRARGVVPRLNLFRLENPDQKVDLLSQQ